MQFICKYARTHRRPRGAIEKSRYGVNPYRLFAVLGVCSKENDLFEHFLGLIILRRRIYPAPFAATGTACFLLEEMLTPIEATEVKVAPNKTSEPLKNLIQLFPLESASLILHILGSFRCVFTVVFALFYLCYPHSTAIVLSKVLSRCNA